MSKFVSSLNQFVVQNYIRPKAAYRLKPMILRRDLSSTSLSPLEHRQLNRFLYGFDLSHQQLAHAIDAIRKVEDAHSIQYIAPGYGGANRRMTSYRLAKHILGEYTAQANSVQEEGPSAREQARHRILDQPRKEQSVGDSSHVTSFLGTHASSKHVTSFSEHVNHSEPLRASLNRTIPVPFAHTPSVSSSLARPMPSTLWKSTVHH